MLELTSVFTIKLYFQVFLNGSEAEGAIDTGGPIR